MNNTVGIFNDNVVIINEPGTPVWLERCHQSFHKKPVSVETDQQINIAKAATEIVATFYSHHGGMIGMKRLQRKLLHLTCGGVTEGFFTTYDENYASVETDLFPARLKKVEVMIKNEKSASGYSSQLRWCIAPTTKNHKEATAQDKYSNSTIKGNTP